MKFNITETNMASDVDFSNLETELKDHVIKQEVGKCIHL